MNKARRKRLETVMELIDEAKGLLECVAEDEAEALGNLPESIQMSEKGEKMDDNIYAMESCMDDLESVVDTLSEIVEV